MPASQLRLAACAVLVGSVSACASYSGATLVPGMSTRVDTRALMGEPAAVHAAAPGAPYAESWEYPRGPLGRHTYMARFDSQGRLVSIDQVLTVATVARLRIGQDVRDDVNRLLGRPAMTYPLPGGGEAWDYAALDTDGRLRRIRLVVNFDQLGRVAAAGESQDPEELGPKSRGR